MAAVVVILVVAVGGLAVATLSRPGPSASPATETGEMCAAAALEPSRAAEARRALAEVDEALAPAARPELDALSRRLDELLAGTLSPSDAAGAAAETGAGFALARQQLGELVFPEWAAGLHDVAYQGTSLYVEAAHSALLATRAEGQQRSELAKKASRERRLGEATIGRARAALGAPDPPVSPPDYTGVEPGPPFAPTRRTPGVAAVAAARCQPFSEWLPLGQQVTNDVTARIAKQPLALQVFVDGGDPADLRTTGTALARDVFAAADSALGAQALPVGAEEATLVLRDALHVYEEMARSMAEATFVEGDLRAALVEKAKRERLIGDELWNHAAARLNEESGVPGAPGVELFRPAPASGYDPVLNGAKGPFDPSKAPRRPS